MALAGLDDFTFPPGSSGNVVSAGADGVPQPGDRVGSFILIKRLGSGSFGAVFSAERADGTGLAAVKILHPSHGATHALEHFRAEAEILRDLDNPHFLRVYESGTTSTGRTYYAMELVPKAETITTAGGKHPLRVYERIDLLIGVCRAMVQAHQRRLVHRDLKPNNILVSCHQGEWTAYVIDFGIAKALARSFKTYGTLDGAIVGTYGYMSPEQLDGDEDVDGRSDIYSLGVVLHEAVTGKPPIDPARFAKVPEHERLEYVRSLTLPRVKRVEGRYAGALGAIIARATERDADERYQRMEEFLEDLEGYQRGARTRAYGTTPWQRFLEHVERMGKGARWQLGVAAMVASLLILYGLGRPLLFEWTTFGAAHEPLVRTFAAMIRPPATLTQTRVVQLTAQNPASALGVAAGVTGVTDANALSERIVHGALLKSLSVANPMAVIVDVQFPGNAYQAELAEGLDALDQGHVPWAAFVQRWPLDGYADEMDKVRQDPRGRYAAGTISDQVLAPGLELAIRRGNAPPEPGLALYAVAARDCPGAGFDVTIENDRTLRLSYWRPDPANPAIHSPVGRPTDVEVSYRKPLESDETYGYEVGDEAFVFEFPCPPNDQLAAASMDAREVLTASPEALRDFGRCKVVVVGNARPGKDEATLKSGQNMPGSQLLAAGINALLAGRTSHAMNAVDQFECQFLGALAGTWIGARLPKRSVSRLAWYAAAAVLLLAATTFSYAKLGVQFSPIPLVIGVVLAGEISAWMFRQFVAGVAPGRQQA